MSDGPVPDQLWLVESYLNSIDVETGGDDLDSASALRRWLTARHRADLATTITEADLALVRELRHELRELLAAHCHGATGTDSARLDALVAGVSLHARFDTGSGRVDLVPAGDGVSRFLGEVVAAIVRADADGLWRRLKLCREETCAMVFYDRSKNASRCWCSMKVCGNRAKTRAYRRRSSSTETSAADGGSAPVLVHASPAATHR